MGKLQTWLKFLFADNSSIFTALKNSRQYGEVDEVSDSFPNSLEENRREGKYASLLTNVAETQAVSGYKK